jgi:aspartyl-tRNA(Asn)/glutamyl-tRNA(Gln) amidotransferase subunit A
MSLAHKTLAEIARDLAAKTYSSVEVTQFFLDRITTHNPELNAFITVCTDSALSSASAADKKIASGQAGPLTGVPYAHKDIFCTDGIKTTCGSKMLDNFIAPYDATVTTKFKEAGLVMVAKTNMDEFAMGSSNENSFYGPVKNPWDLSRIPGGSSGGSAAAVAARLIPAATGTDTGGSIRQPASMCNITGIKPTYGTVSRYGMIAFASSLDQGGPFAQTAEDVALLLNIMAGHDEKDSTSLNRPVPNYAVDLNKPLTGLTVGFAKEHFATGLDNEVATVIQAAIHELEKLGATIKEISLPNTHLAVPAYYVIAPAECSSNLARFDGVRYGYRCENPKNLEDMYLRSRGEGFGQEIKRRIIVGTYALSSGYYDAYYLKAQKIRRLISNDYTEAFKSVDLIVGPTAPSPAFKLGEKVDDPVSMYLSDIYTIGVNLAGLPGMSIPAGFVSNLPVGLQLIGNYFDETRLLNVAHQFQQATDWHKKIPAAFS